MCTQQFYCTAQMNSKDIDFNTRFRTQQEHGIGEGLETAKGAKASDQARGDDNSGLFADLIMYRQRAKNAYQ